jgi:Carbohydrate binding module (family 6)/F5/8 type C domain/Glycosyl hydrolase family 95 catalytic domain
VYALTSARRRALVAVALAVAVSTAGVGRPGSPAVAAPATDTAWHNGSFNLDRPNLVRRSNIVLGRPNATAQESMPLGNGSLGVAAWAAGGLTAQLNRSDTLPDRRSPGQITIPGLARITGAADFAAHLDLYDGVLTEAGAGMTAQIYVRADADMLVVDVTGADPASTQTAQIGLWSGRSPAAVASGALGTLAETWTDDQTGGTGATYGSLAALTAGGRNVSASVVDARTVRVTFNPNADGSFRVLIGGPTWTGGNALAVATALFGSSASTPSATLQAPHLAWWHGFWASTNLMKINSAAGSGEYLENLRTFYLYQEAGLNRGTGNVPGTQAGVADMYSYNQDTHDWIPADVWWWNVRMQVTANMTSGVTALNSRFFNLYVSNLANIQAWTSAHLPGTTGACVPETMRFNGNGYYGNGTPQNNASCDTTIAPSYNSQTMTTGAEVSLAIWQQYLMTGDTAFLSAGYPLMKASAQFLLSYATTGSDGLLHTISNAHETQWHVRDPITDVVAMKALFPAVQRAAQTLNTDAAFVTQLDAAIAKLRDYPRTDAATHSQVLTASSDAGGQDVLALSAEPTATLHNTENLDLEATYPYGLIGDTAGTLNDLARRTYNSRLFRNNADWSYDALHAARLGLAGEVQATLVASAQKFQLLPSGMANLFGSATSNEPYNEQTGIVAAALNEALVQDYDGLLRIAPAWPSGWDVDGTVSVQHNSKLDVQVRNGVPSTVVLEAGANAAMQVRSPWPGQSVQVVDATTGATVVGPTTTSPFTITTSAGHAYLIEQTAQPFPNLPYAQVTGTPAAAAKHLGPVSIGLDGGGGPFGGTPAAVPGVVQAENYNTGGQGVAYSVNSVNGTGNGYRSDGVDIESTSDAGGGYNVGWTSTGQWFHYTVNAASAGVYTVNLRVAAPNAVAGALHIANASGTNLSGNISIPATGGWQNWTTVTVQVTLPAGQQTLTIYQDNGGWNINSLQFTSSSGPFGGTPAAIPGVVQAENYDTGGQGVGYSVTSVNGTANSYRADGVDIETTSDTGGGYNVGWTSGGQWFRYTVNVASAGAYTVNLRVAAPSAVTGAVHIANASGTNLSGNINIPATGGWQTWTTVTAQVTLPAGQQVLTLAEDTGGWNINSLQFAASGASNLAAGRPATESSHNDVYTAANVTDGNQSTYWESVNNAFPQWVQVDLGSSQSASRVVLQLPPSWGARDQTLSLLASTDGSTFTTVKAAAAYTFSPAGNNTVTLTFPATTQRYWRVTITANTGWPAGQVSEFQIWNS